MLQYATYDPIVYGSAKRMGIKLDKDDCHEIKTFLWESHERFLDENDAHDRVLTLDETKHLKNRLHMRARGAIIDMIRFKTWTKSDTPVLVYQPLIKTKEEFFDRFIETVDFSENIMYKITLDKMLYGDMIKEYVMGSTMKEIGNKRGLTEARISQIFKELT